MKRKHYLRIAVVYLVCLACCLPAIATAVVDVASLFGNSPSSAPKTLSVANLVPGQNLLTGSANAYTFEAEDVFDCFYNGQGAASASLVDFELATDPADSGHGAVLAVTLDNAAFSEKYSDPATFIYYQVAVGFEKALDRPVHLVFDTFGKNQIGFWLGAGSTHKNFGKPSGGWQRISIDNVSVFNGNMRGMFLQYATRPSDCSQTQYFDNIALYPYYRIRYNALYPDGSVGSNVEKFWFDASALTVAADGTVSGLPTRYPVEQTALTFAGYDLVGWSTERGASEAMTEVALSGKDVELYPVWEKQKIRKEVTLTVWLDGAKTESLTEKLFVGDAYTLPSYKELAPYTPDGTLPQFCSADAVYTPGSRIFIKEGADTMEIEAIYGAPEHPEYGELVFFENFETLVTGTKLYDPTTGSVNAHPASFVNKNVENADGAFTFRLGDTSNELFVADDGTGNHVLAVQQRNTWQRWPQFIVDNLAPASEDGLYTLCADFYAPAASAAHINDYDMRIFYNASNFKDTAKKGSEVVGDTWIHLSCSLPVTAGGAYEALTKLQLYVSTDGVSSDAVFYVDNVSLYVKKASVRLEMNETASDMRYFTPGEVVMLPRRDEAANYTPRGFELAGFRMGGTLYAPGESYQTKAEDRTLVFSAVYQEKVYALAFSPNGGYGTIADLEVTDGETVTLPRTCRRHDGASLVGWKAYGSDAVLAPGSAYTFDLDAAEAYLDGADCLFFTAVWDKEPTENTMFQLNYPLTEDLFDGASASELDYLKLAYGAGLVPASASFHGEETVSVSELVRLADRLYYRSRGLSADYSTNGERYQAMFEKGICREYADLSAEATYADFAYVLANALSDDCYAEMVYDVAVNGLDKSDEGYYQARKLLHAGILPESTDFTAKLSRAAMVEALAKTVQPALRRTETNRTLYILGDSLCAGTGGSSHTGWVRKLENYVGGRLDIVNYAIGGIDTRSYLTESPWNNGKELYENMMRAIRPGDYVMIALGTNDSTLWDRGSMTFESSRDNYARYVSEIRAAGGIPFLVCPAGRNTVDANGSYYESDPRIIECMNAVGTVIAAPVPIINFKTLSLERFGAMSAAERAKIYHDSVHYTDYGAQVVCSYFSELLTADKDNRLDGLRAYFTVKELLDDDESLLYPTPLNLNQYSLRNDVALGMRFSSFISAVQRDSSTEYGFIVALADSFEDNDYSDLVFPESLKGDTVVAEQTTGKGTTASGKRFLYATSYDKDSEIDICKPITRNDLDGFRITAVLVNVAGANRDTKFVVRAYIRVDGNYYYGAPMVKSYNDIANGGKIG